MKKSLLICVFAFLLLLFAVEPAGSTYGAAGDTFTSADGITYSIKSESSGTYYSGGNPGSVTVLSYETSRATDVVRVPSLVVSNNREYYVTEISDFAFAGSGFSTITLPYTVEKIGRGSFASCTKLKSIEIPEYCLKVGSACFYGCSSLKQVSIFGSLSTIGDGCFSFCNELTTFKIERTNRNFAVKGDFLTNETGSVIVFGLNATGKVIIPDTVKTIRPFAFEGDTAITGISFGSSVKEVPQGCFLSCSSLESLDLTGIKTIGKDAFCDCPSITKLSIPASVTSIAGNPFGYCIGLISISVDKDNPSYSAKKEMLLNKAGNTLICGNALKGSVTLDISVRYVGDYAFYGNRLLTGILFTASLKDIGDYAFKGCSNLTRVRFSSRRTVLTGKDIFKDSYYYIEMSLPYSNKAWAADSIEVIVQSSSPRGALFSYWTQ